MIEIRRRGQRRAAVVPEQEGGQGGGFPSVGIPPAQAGQAETLTHSAPRPHQRRVFEIPDVLRSRRETSGQMIAADAARKIHGFQRPPAFGGSGQSPGLKILESIPLDNRHKLIATTPPVTFVELACIRRIALQDGVNHRPVLGCRAMWQRPEVQREHAGAVRLFPDGHDHRRQNGGFRTARPCWRETSRRRWPSSSNRAVSAQVPASILSQVSINRERSSRLGCRRVSSSIAAGSSATRTS